MINQTVRIYGRVAYIELQDYTESIVDTADLARLAEYHAMKTSHGYVKLRKKGGHRGSLEPYLHRFIARAPKGAVVDHVDGNRLDNRKANLRLTTYTGNARSQRGLRRSNTSGFRGVSRHKQTCRWRAYIKVDRKQISLGLYTNPIDAARAYNEAAKLLHGEFATLNQLD